jgi:sugar lactone lactonase YvrE
LVNSGADATTVAANSTTFTMHSTVASGSAYDISLGKQPYGLTLACTVSGGSGTATANVTSIAVSCSNVTPTQTAIAGYFGAPNAVAVDASGNVFVADAWNDAVKEIPFSGGAYGAPVILAAGFLTGTQLAEGESCPSGIAVSPTGNLFVICNGVLDEIPFTGGNYGAPLTVNSGFSSPQGVAVDATGNVFVADSTANAVYEVPFNGTACQSPWPRDSLLPSIPQPIPSPVWRLI